MKKHPILKENVDDAVWMKNTNFVASNPPPPDYITCNVEVPCNPSPGLEYKFTPPPPPTPKKGEL